MHSTTIAPSWRVPSLIGTPLILLGALMQPAIAAAEPDEREPAEIYRQVCSYCHASEYGVGPDTITMAVPEAGREAWSTHIRGVVRNGRAAMPAFRDAKISDAELDALAEALARGDFAEPEAGEE
ncbi:cytochrome c [Billgrantia diversa]|uniref:c-type cytochrome n=1 Tax=Halomonas sp. MCCC 1A13316 TaxID=2733487 RepID=UPI0018A43B85|nr:cytochrome c [Halomonas sp. MCCC 1A13316]QOR40361.1 cytochrome c [Halomonas sp. MCCC 1A13316]